MSAEQIFNYKIYEFIHLPSRKSEFRIFRKVGNAEKQNASNDKMFRTFGTREAANQIFEYTKNGIFGEKCGTLGRNVEHRKAKTTKNNLWYSWR